jgi:hypothetical protein
MPSMHTLLFHLQLSNILTTVVGITIVVALYGVFARSIGLYPSSRQLWKMLLISLASSYVLGALILIFLGLPTFAVILSAALTFVIGNATEKDESDEKEGDKSGDGEEKSARYVQEPGTES